MVFQQLHVQTAVLVYTVCLVLVFTSAGNLQVNAVAQQFEAQTLEGGCPVTQEEFERVRSELLQDIGPLIEKLPPTQSPTTGGTTKQSTTPPTTGETTEQSTPTATEPLYDCNGFPGWRRVVFINMTDTSYNCPPGLNLTSYSKRTCGRAHSDEFSCSSTTFSVGGSEYSQVCGRIRGYQVGSTQAFWGYLVRSLTIDGWYVDGLSLTHGAVGERQHIWTFAAGISEVAQFHASTCPCDTTDETVLSPPFADNEYFCESGLHTPWPGSSAWGTPFLDDPLWDGQNCTSTSTCCQLNNPPWFTKNLTNTTTDDIELRTCLSGPSSTADTPLELIELYVQ